MAIETANDLFIDELKDIYSAEKQALRIYPRMAKAVSTQELKDALQMHLEQTRGQVERLDQVFEILEKRATGKTCDGMKGVLEEAQEAIEEISQGPVRDAALIAAAQRVEHYEIAAYGTVVALAKSMGQKEIVDLLSETLEEEKQTDKKLTGISKSVNKNALAEVQEEEEEEEDDAYDEEEDDEDVDEEDVDEEQAAEAAPAKRTPKGKKK